VITISQAETVATATPRRVGCLVSGMVALLLFVGAMVAIPIILTNKVTQMAPKLPVQVQIEDLKLPTGMPEPTEVPTPTEVPPSPTPRFANGLASYSSTGIGPGALNRSVYITVDGAGTVYVADYQDGRIQAFDPDINYLHGWQVGDTHTIVYGMTATHDGTVYVAYDGDIYRFEGSSGKALGKLDYANGPEFGDLTILPDGGVLGVWYEGRWGLISSLEGHRDDLVWFDADGKTVRTLKSAISGQTDSLALETTVAVDGQGSVYALKSLTDRILNKQSKIF
jgi:DNA-binding beta-propeller fold protein YncE